MKKKLNKRLLLSVLLPLVLLCGGVHLLHDFQAKVYAHTLLSQATEAEEGRLDKAALCLKQSLTFADEDVPLLVRYGQILDRLPATRQTRRLALSVYQKVLASQPARQDIRQRVAVLALELGLPAEGRQHVEILLAIGPESADLLGLLAQCREAEGDDEGAALSLEKAIIKEPGQEPHYEHLATLYDQRLKKPSNADAVMDALIRARPASPSAYLIRARYHAAHGSLEKSSLDLAHAAVLAPEAQDVLVVSGEVAWRRGRMDDALGFYRKAVEDHPKDPALYCRLADLEWHAEGPEMALITLRRGLNNLPDQPTLLAAIAEVMIRQGATSNAAAIIAHMHKVAVSPCLTDYLHASLLIQQGQRLQATHLLEKVIQSPDLTPGLITRISVALGHCHEDNGEQEKALRDYLRALSSGEFQPILVYLTARLLDVQGRSNEADQWLQTLTEQGLCLATQYARQAAEIALRARHPERALLLARHATDTESRDYRDHLWLGEMLAFLGRPHEAEGELRHALELAGHSPDAWIALVRFLDRNGQTDQAKEVVAQVPAGIEPRQLPLARAQCYEVLGWKEQALEQYRTALAQNPNDFMTLRPYATLCLSLGQRQQADFLLRKLLQAIVAAPEEDVAWARKQLEMK